MSYFIAKRDKPVEGVEGFWLDPYLRQMTQSGHIELKNIKLNWHVIIYVNQDNRD